MLKSSFMVIVAMFLGSAFSFASDGVEKLSMDPGYTYKPSGFDSNDIAQVVIEGTFANYCYQMGMSEVVVDDVAKSITIDNGVQFTNSTFCAQALVNYWKTIDIGVLKEGVYEIFFKSDEKLVSHGTLQVSLAKQIAADDYFYAPVSESYFLHAKNGLPDRMILTGKLTNSCIELNKPMLFVEKSPRVIEILPTATMKTENCQEVEKPFELTVELKDLRPRERYLVHVRSMNGQALNRVIEIYPTKK